MNRMAEEAAKYGKPDVERLGIFIEMPYLNGKGYVPAFAKLKPFKGLNMYPGGTKLKCGTQSGYFDDEFRRLFVGEGITWRKKKGKQAKKLLTPFLPAGVTKKHATPGDHHGTFGGIVEAFSRLTKKLSKKKQESGNFSTNPGKKGGYGYVDICLSKYPEHRKDPYRPKIKIKAYGKQLNGPLITCHYPQPFFGPDPFIENNKKNLRLYVKPKKQKLNTVGDGKWMPTGPAKWPGGCKAGMFDRFPEHMTERNKKKRNKAPPKGMGVPYLPQSTALKTMFTTSILKLGVNLSCNFVTYKTLDPKYTNRMLKPLF